MTPVSHYDNLLTVTPALRTKPRLAAWLLAIFKQCQHLEEVAIDLLQMMDIATADRTRLEMIAGIVDQPIITDDLETLRKLVSARIAINRSSGRRNDLLRSLSILLGDIEDLTKSWSSYDGGVEVVLRTDADLPDYLTSLLEEAMASGFSIRVLHAPDGGGFAFGGSGPGWGETPPDDTVIT